MNRVRNSILNALFSLLYGRIVVFHELAGQILYGASWHARRLVCLDSLSSASIVVDVGAGEGRLVEDASKRAIVIQGFDPSAAMRTAAHQRGVCIARGSSFDLPLAAGSVDVLIATYPGAWIIAPDTWAEFDRVLAANGTVRLLLGGSYESGPGSRLRSKLIRLAYGQSTVGEITFASAEDHGFTVTPEVIEDCWGRASYVDAWRTKS